MEYDKLDIDFYKIRSIAKGQTDGFEELCCQLFFREFNQVDNEYNRFRGDGGDGGVEALFEFKDGSKIALQSKYWEGKKFDSSQVSQLTKSIDAAKKNHPDLISYFISIPFNLTGPVSGGKRGKSQTEKFKDWKQKKEQQHSIEIKLWADSRLSELLLKHDQTGGLRRYWFDSSTLNDHQYKNHIEEATAQAGRRYTPKLSIKVPLLKALDSFVKPAVISGEVKEHLLQYDKKLTDSLFQKVVKNHYENDGIQLEEIKSKLEQLLSISDNSFKALQQEFLSLLNSQLEKLSFVEKELLNELQKKYGDDFHDTPGFRQFHAEYMCAFPAGELDSTREVVDIIKAIRDWLQSEPVKLNYCKQMLIRGVAGIGKTHSVIDYVREQNRPGLWFFFGEDFTETEPWKVMADKLGLTSTIARDEIFEVFSTQAVSKDETSVIFIDALNESDKRQNWKKWLPVLIEQVKRYPKLKLCVTCRDTYLDEVFERREEWVEFTHNGFLGQEYIAIQEFFNFYQLKPPVVPLLQSEFRNPLFLHLVCDSLSGAGYEEIPRGRLGFQDMLNICIDHKDKLLSKKCNCDPNIQIVRTALSKIALQMAEKETRFIDYFEVKKITDKLHAGTGFETSLLNQLEKEGLIAFIEHKEQPFGPSTKYCRFTFERIADFFIAFNVLESNQTSKELSSLFSSKWVIENKGVLEALAIMLPESNPSSEIIEYENEPYGEHIAEVFVESLQWRDLKKTTDSTKRQIEQLLYKNGELAAKVFNALISISMVPENILNAYYLEDLLWKNGMCSRDSFWNYYLIEDFEKKNSAWTIIKWACFSNVDNYSKESLFLWAVTLSWFTSCSDRVVRDRSSKGIVRILCADITNCNTLLEHFRYIDDDYILERVTSAIYSALLLTKDKKVTSELALEIVEKKHLSQFDNVIIYDSLRLIIELAFIQDETISAKIDLDNVRQTFSNNKFTIYDEEISTDLLESKAFNNSNIKMGGGGLSSDFQRYILEPRLRIFDLESAGITKKDIYRWFLIELSKLGYPGPDERCWKFDRYLMGKHGNGRAKPTKAERLGKKYYWTLLHRVLGQLRNTVPFKAPQYSDTFESSHPRLLSLPVRKIDLTDLRYLKEKKYLKIVSPEYTIAIETEPSEWTTNTDNFNDVPGIIQDCSDKEGEKWIPLLYSARVKAQDAEEKYPYRDSTILLSSLVLLKNDISSMKASIKKEKIVRDVFGFTTNDYRIFLGEYPFTRPCLEQEETGAWRHEYSITNDITAKATTMNMLRGGEWQYDCSFESESCLVPSRNLIESLGLKWDGYQGWDNEKGDMVIFFAETEKGNVVWIKKSYLQQFLCTEKVLLYISYNEKMYVDEEMSGARGMHSRRGVYCYDGENVEVLQNISDTCDFR